MLWIHQIVKNLSQEKLNQTISVVFDAFMFFVGASMIVLAAMTSCISVGEIHSQIHERREQEAFASAIEGILS